MRQSLVRTAIWAVGLICILVVGPMALAKAEFIKADRVLRHEVTKRFPDMSLGPIFESEEGVERLGLGVGVSLPLWNRNRRAIVEACATRRVARSAYQARYQDLIARLARACADQSAMVAHMDRTGSFVALIPAVQGFGQFIGPNISASILDADLGYGTMFIVSGCMVLVALALYIGVWHFMRKSKIYKAEAAA